MRDFWMKLGRRVVVVAAALGVVGFLFAEAFLMLHRMNGGVPDPANEAVRWRTPLTMAGFGVALLLVMEFVAFAIRRKAPPAAAPAAPAPTANLTQSPNPGQPAS